MATINPYINFNGNAEEAFNFYKSVFGGDFSSVKMLQRPRKRLFPVSESEANKIMRIVLPIGESKLIANDVPEALGRVNENENRSKISVRVDSREEADKIASGLSAGGTVEMPADNSPWGLYFAMFRDKYGIEDSRIRSKRQTGVIKLAAAGQRLKPFSLRRTVTLHE